MTDESKPVIATMINTAALALTSYGVLRITSSNDYSGAFSIAMGFGLELLKYIGMKHKYW